MFLDTRSVALFVSLSLHFACTQAPAFVVTGIYTGLSVRLGL